MLVHGTVRTYRNVKHNVTLLHDSCTGWSVSVPADPPPPGYYLEGYSPLLGTWCTLGPERLIELSGIFTGPQCPHELRQVFDEAIAGARARAAPRPVPPPVEPFPW